MIIEIMKKYIPRVIKNIVKRGLDCLDWDEWACRSWSQEGEDMVLRRFFEHKKKGFYVDVGAHHPKRFSNTYWFYKKGWRGINIDAMPGSMNLFNKWRPRDINLEMGVANKSAVLDYYIFNEPALNSFSCDISKKREQDNGAFHIKEVIKVNVCPLREILAEHLAGNSIDFLSVDVEGYDLDVLQSNDWSKYRPKIVLAEILNSSVHGLTSHSLVQFMAQQDYVVYGKQVNTVFFLDARADVV